MSFEVDRVADITIKEFYQRFSSQNLPVVITGCIEHWPARAKWNLDYFAQKFAHKKVNFSGKDWVVGNFIDQLLRGVSPAPYLNQVKLDEQFQELATDIGDLRYTRKNFLNSRFLPMSMRIDRGIKALFIGGAGSGFGKLHWDYSYLHVYISQVCGDKDFLLYAPSDSKYLYPRPDYPNDSSIRDINNIDVNEYPDLLKATPIRLTVKEGETIFIPAGWWHATQMQGVSISIAESALDHANWRQRCKGFLAEYKKQKVSRLKLALLGSYMRVVQTVLL